MPDIFLSYNREDQTTARRFAEAFQAAGFDVWWDTTLRAGEAYDEVTEAALNEARAVVVLWSPRSAASRWVRAEATQADRNKTLVPVTIEACKRPIMFELTQTADLSHWQGEPADKAWLALLEDVKRFVERGAFEPQVTPAMATSPVVAASPAKLSICVLPFANMSNDADQEYFADGISEDIITDLSKVSALSVTSRNTAFTFKGKHVDLKQVARQLGVTNVLEGSVRKAGNRVRITAQLIAGASDDHVWAERYDRDLDDIFALQDEISEAVVTALKLKLFPEEKKAIEDRGTTNVEAYDLYLRARALARTYSPAEILRAIEVYRQALALDPDFAPAWAGLARALSRAIVNAAGDRTQALKDREEAFSRALALAPDAWSTQLSLAGQLTTQRAWTSAELAYARTRELAPASEPSVLSGLGYFLAEVGRSRESVGLVRSALRAEPLSLEASIIVQIMLDNVSEHAEAQAEYERSKDLAGDRAIAEWWALKRCWWRGDDAARVRQQFVRYLSYESLILPVFRDLVEALVDPAAALALIRSAHDDPAYQDASRQSVLSSCAARYGDQDLALAAMRRSLFDLNSVTRLWIWEPTFAKLREDPRFKDVLRDLGLVDYWRSSGKCGDLVRPAGDDDFEVIG